MADAHSLSSHEDSTAQTDTPIRMYTTTWCGDCFRAKRLFGKLGIPYTEINIDHDHTAAEYVREVNHGMRSVPTIIFPDGSRLVEPSNMVLEAKLREYQR